MDEYQTSPPPPPNRTKYITRGKVIDVNNKPDADALIDTTTPTVTSVSQKEEVVSSFGAKVDDIAAKIKLIAKRDKATLQKLKAQSNLSENQWFAAMGLSGRDDLF